MKTLLTLSALVLSTVTFNAFAAGTTNEVKKENKAAAISMPSMNWGEADQVDEKEIEILKYNKTLVQLPSMNWGSADEISIVTPSIELPAMNWGSPEEVNAGI
jgi:short-subunit dehydrogenase